MKSASFARCSWPGGLLVALLCLVASVAAARHHRAAYSGGGEPGRFDYYLLSLSWSPTYCLTHPEDGPQCSGKGFGFVLHGLWPQFDAGGYPENCAADTTLSAEAAALGRTIFPSPKLVEHEWRSHGSCSGMDAARYFRTADHALAAVRVPARFEAPQAMMTMTAAEIAAEFRAANPAMPDGAIAVTCSRGPW